MSLTVIAFAIAAVSMVLAVTFFTIADKPLYGLAGGVFIAIALGSVVVGISSFSQNYGETKRQSEINCVEDGGKIINFSDTRICFTEESEIIRKF